MPPQAPAPFSPAPILPPPQLPVAPPAVSPLKKRWWVLIVIILVILGISGGLAYIFIAPRSSAPVTNIDTKHVGTYSYVNACNAFTADDFEAATGLKSDRSKVTASFAGETDASDPARSYRSYCSRYELQKGVSGLLSVDVTITQYPDTQRTKQQLFIFGFDSTTQVDPELGGLASFESPRLRFQKDNTLTSVVIQGYDGMSDSQVETYTRAIAKKISARLSENTDLSTLAYPVELTGEGYIYQNACSLWGMADFEGQFGKVNKTLIFMDYAEALTAEADLPNDAKESVHTSCVMGTKEYDGAFAYIDAFYYPTVAKAQAGYDSYADPAYDIMMPGLGDKAVLQAYSTFDNQYESVMVLRGTTMFKVKFVPEDISTRGDSKVQAEVKAMAGVVLGRLR